VTPGTLTEEKFLEARKSNYLAAIAIDPTVSLSELNSQTKDTMTIPLSLAWLELSTGEFQMSPSSRKTCNKSLDLFLLCFVSKTQMLNSLVNCLLSSNVKYGSDTDITK
jgi:DNA mismatch repair ATPase MutS